MLAPRFRLTRLGLLALTYSLLLSSATYSATILSQEALFGGLFPKHGDSITASIILAANETGIVLEVQPFVISKDSVEPIKAKSRPLSSVIERLSLDQFGNRGDRSPTSIVKVSAVFPYGTFSLAHGDYQIAYELRLVKDGKVIFLRATQPYLVAVRAPDPNKMTTTTSSVRALAAEQRISIGHARVDGELKSFEISETIYRPVLETAIREVRDDGFHMAWGEGPTVPVAPLSEFEPAQRRVVYFATNRNATTGNRSPDKLFGNETAKLSYGSCVVNIPIASHQPGDLTVKKHFWQKADPNQFFEVEVVNKLADDGFFGSVKSEDILVFIHGYCNSFVDCLLKTAQIHHDIRFVGKPVAFSWPSAGTLGAYSADEKANEGSIGSLANFLAELLRTSQGHRVHVIAHSMGNRLFLEAVRRLELENKLPKEGKAFGHVVLAAPDIAANQFSNLAPRVVASSLQVTYYYAVDDRALSASRFDHLDCPSGLQFFHIDGMETINATYAINDWIGHSYVSSSPMLLSDLRLAINLSWEAAKRKPPLTGPLLDHGFQYWAFPTPK